MTQQSQYEWQQDRLPGGPGGPEMDDERDEEGLADADYPVKCVCGFFGMRFDCKRKECPDCGLRVTKEFNEEGL